MIAKLNGASSLPAEGPELPGKLQDVSREMPEVDATEATIRLCTRPITRKWAASGHRPRCAPRSERTGRGQCDGLPTASGAAENHRIRPKRKAAINRSR